MSKKFSITIIEAPDQNQRENPNNQFSNSEPMTFTQKVEYVKSIDMTNNKQQTEINAVEYIDKVNQFAKENNTGKPKQQTAVEWLWEIAYNRELTVKDWKQAKAMHKEEIENAYREGWMENIRCKHTPNRYYNETFGSSDSLNESRNFGNETQDVFQGD